MPRSKRSISWRELRVGIFVVSAIGLLIFLILNASGDISPFSGKLHLRARFGSAEGLRAGSEVRLAGVRVGKVDDIILLQPSDDPTAPKVEAKLVINDDIDGRPANERIRTDSTAQLESLGILGTDKMINITPGTSMGQPIKEGTLLRTSTTNTLTDLAASSEELVNQLNKLTMQVNDITRKVNEGEGTLGLFVNDEALYNLNAAIRDVQDISKQIRSSRGTAGKLIYDEQLYSSLNNAVARVDTVINDIQRGRGTAGKLLTDEELYNQARSTLTRLNRSAEDINSILVEVRAGRGTVGKLLSDETIYNDARAAIARLNTTSERIDGVISSAQRGEGTLGKLLVDEQLYTNINQLSGETVKLLYDFRQNPKKYLTVKFEIF
jgi:phospholipid/cholesterol/gamma-HCH transport system substrate-binding protein